MPHPCAFALLFFLPIAACAQADTISIRIDHRGCGARLTLAEMKTLTHHSARIKSHDGAEATYEGAWLKEVLGLHCSSIGTLDKRTMVRSAVRVGASDGYSALVALTECDSSFRERPVLLTWLRDGKPLGDHDGPLQLIVPDDMRHARDVRKVNRLEVITP